MVGECAPGPSGLGSFKDGRTDGWRDGPRMHQGKWRILGRGRTGLVPLTLTRRSEAVSFFSVRPKRIGRSPLQPPGGRSSRRTEIPERTEEFVNTP